MNMPARIDARVPAMTPEAIDKVAAAEEQMGEMPQVEIRTDHLIHAGLYARTIDIPAGTLLTGARITRPTVLVSMGDCTMWTGDNEARMRLRGKQVIAASAGRKQLIYAHEDTRLTMLFASQAESVEQAEDEFTDEADRLASRARADLQTITITGE